jgi:hypothetical protein
MYVCKEPCFIGRLWRVGDVTDSEELATSAPGKFLSLKSKQSAKIKAEIEDLIPEMAEKNLGRVQPITSTELYESQHPDVFKAEEGE